MQDALSYHKKHTGKIEIAPKTKISNIKDLALAYTPGVASVSQHIAEHPESDIEFTNKGNSVAIITDGTAVLGLGDIGPEAAIPVMEGKSVLFKELGGVDAYPIVLNQTDPQKIIDIVKALEPSFAGINLEDISAPRCFQITQTLQQELSIPVFHDDQHGAGIVVLAGLINALKVVGKNIQDVAVVVNGAGAAGIATAHLLLEFGCNNLTLIDKQGVIHTNQKHTNQYQKHIAKLTDPQVKTNLEDALFNADVFIGLSVGNILTQQMVENMAPNPIVFALANPTPEIMPEIAKSAGVEVMATGRSDYPNQINNVLVFPGLFRGLLDNPSVDLTQELMVDIAKNIASLISSPHKDKIIPSPLDKKVPEIIKQTINNASTKS